MFKKKLMKNTHILGDEGHGKILQDKKMYPSKNKFFAYMQTLILVTYDLLQ